MKIHINTLRILVVVMMIFLNENSFSQQISEKEFAENIFGSSQLINSQTAVIPAAGTWRFGIQHRFGKIGLDSSITQQFLGLDLPSVIRFSFGWTLGDRLALDIGRTNYLKTYDLELKYLIARQTTNFRMPFNMAFYFNAAYRSERFPSVPANAYFEDDTTIFIYKPSHRLSYNSQLILSSKITDKFSVQLSPIFIYENLADPYTDNFTLVLSAGARYKLGFSTAIVAEYAYVFNNRGDSKFYDPFSIGVEFGTVGHSFQLFISNAPRVLGSHIYTISSVNIAAGEFLLGFNLKRSFWNKKSSQSSL